MTEHVGQWICIRFCVKPEHSSMETIQMIQKDAAVGTWWWAASSQQRAHSCITSRAEFFGETSNHPDDSAPLQSRFGTLDFWLFPKLKSPLKEKRFQTVDEIQENTKWGSWWQLGELCEVPRYLLWRGLRHHCPLYNVSCIFFNKCLYFSHYIAGYLLDRPHITCSLKWLWILFNRLESAYKIKRNTKSSIC